MRIRHNKTRGWLTAAVALGTTASLVLAACGDDTDEAASTTAAAAATTAAEATEATITVSGQWARNSPMMATAGAAYMTVTSSADDALVKASVDPSVAGTVELHETRMVEGGMTDTTMAGMDTTETTMAGMDTTETTMPGMGAMGNMFGGGAPEAGDAAVLPLFPLQTVLFPGGLLMLKVFEARYLDLVTRCLRSGHPFGVVCLRQGREVGRSNGPVLFEDMGVQARIDEVDGEQAGILKVRCLGLERFRLAGRPTQQPDGLWQAAFNGQRTWATSAGEDRYRRGLYTFWRRTVPYPSMRRSSFGTFWPPTRDVSPRSPFFV